MNKEVTQITTRKCNLSIVDAVENKNKSLSMLVPSDSKNLGFVKLI